MRKFNALPTWLLTCLIRPFLPETHSLKMPISLHHWHAGRSDLCVTFDILLAANALFLPIFLFMLFN